MQTIRQCCVQHANGWTLFCQTVQYLNSVVSNSPIVGLCCVQMFFRQYPKEKYFLGRLPSPVSDLVEYLPDLVPKQVYCVELSLLVVRHYPGFKQSAACREGRGVSGKPS